MTVLMVVLLSGVGVAAVVSSYRLIRSDGGGPRRSPLPAEPSEGNTILPYPRGRRSRDCPGEDVVEQRRRALERRSTLRIGAQRVGAA